MNHGNAGFTTPDVPELQVYDKGALELLKRRAAVNVEDDHFNDNILSPKWLPFGPPISPTLSDLPGWLGFSSSGGDIRGYIQPVPSGDWFAETEIICGTEASIEWGGSGLILTNSTTWASSLTATFTAGGRASAGLTRMNNTKFINGAYTSNYIEVFSANSAISHLFLRLRKLSTTYYFYWSSTGKTWYIFSSITADTLGFTPTYFGLGTLTSYNAFFNYFLRYTS